MALQLAAPPSLPELSLADLPVTMHLIGTDITQQHTTDASGTASFASLPGGTWQLQLTTQGSNQLWYTVNATVFVTSNMNVVATPRTTSDVLAGVAALQATSTTLAFASSPRSNERAAAPESALTAGAAAVYAVAGSENQRVVSTTVVPVSQGTQTVRLTFSVSTAEYPVYVLQQSEFNDNWEVFLLAGSGEELFSLARNVNSQLTTEPIWNASGSTGTIVKTLDVHTLTESGATELTLVATATNIGDSALATSVSASVDASAFDISSIVRDNVPSSSAYSQTQQSRVSIPNNGETNTAQRTFDVNLTGLGATDTVDAVRVRCLNAANGSVLSVFEDTPRGSVATELAPDKLRVRFTNSTANPSSVPAQSPPPANRVKYEITVVATVNGQQVERKRESETLFALWHMPPGLARYGQVHPDPGGDDWCCRRAFIWMSAY
ncbi:MAG TPA: hypothetical protein VK171_12475, partial [Fimbriimonas sp.]|nr:hypothetical protein [Fimbriimonas sp.]